MPEHVRRPNRPPSARLFQMTALIAIGAVAALLAGCAAQSHPVHGSHPPNTRAPRPGSGGPPAARALGSGCPASAPRRVVSTRLGAQKALVPPGAVRMLLCRYSGLPDSGPNGLANPRADPSGFTLLARGLVRNRDLVARLATALNAIKPPRGGGGINCPSDSGAAVIAAFGYARGPQDPVSVGLEGCQALTNGHLSRLALGAQGVAQIASLTRVRSGFVDAHEARLDGSVMECGGGAPGHCRAVQRHAGEIVKVLTANGDWTAEVQISQGHFSALVAPGEDRLEIVHGWDGAHPQRERRVRAPAGGTVRVHLVLKAK